MTTIKMDARTLKGFMTPLLKSAGRDDMLPVLTGIHLRGINGTLVGTSTDRFRVTVHRYQPDVRPDYQGSGFDLLIPARAIQRLLAVFGPTRGHNPFLVITADDESLTVSDDQNSMTVKKMAGEFPKVASLVAEAAEYDREDVAPAFYVNPHFLADIAAGVPASHRAVTFRPPTKKGRPMVFQVTDDLLVLLMPRKPYEGGGFVTTLDLSSWTDLLGAS